MESHSAQAKKTFKAAVVFSFFIMGLPICFVMARGIYYGLLQNSTSSWLPIEAQAVDSYGRRPAFSYQIDNRMYVCDRLVFMDMQNPADVSDIHVKIQGRSEIAIFVNPEDPGESVFHKGYHKASWDQFFQGLLFFCFWMGWIVLFYLMVVFVRIVEKSQTPKSQP